MFRVEYRHIDLRFSSRIASMSSERHLRVFALYSDITPWSYIHSCLRISVANRYSYCYQSCLPSKTWLPQCHNRHHLSDSSQLLPIRLLCIHFRLI